MLYRCANRAPAADHGHAATVRRGNKYLTVDIHCHVHVPEADDLLRERTRASDHMDQKELSSASGLTARINARQQQAILPKLTDPAVRIADMDRQGVDIQALSPSPFHYNYGAPAEVGRVTAKVVNDRIAEVVAGNPDRFVGMGTLPLQDGDMAVAELERCVKDLGFRGVEISTHVNGRDLTRAGLEKFFARTEELGVLIFIHPIGSSITERMTDHYFLNLIGHPFESALAIGHLVFDGYLETYPGLKICVAHGGGYVPAYSGRFDHPFELREDCRVNLSKPPSEYVKKLYFDTIVFTEHQLRYLIETWGAERIVMGTDYPYDMAETDPVGHVNSVKGLNEADKARVLGGNAADLLSIVERVPR